MPQSHLAISAKHVLERLCVHQLVKVLDDQALLVVLVLAEPLLSTCQGKQRDEPGLDKVQNNLRQPSILVCIARGLVDKVRYVELPALPLRDLLVASPNRSLLELESAVLVGNDGDFEVALPACQMPLARILAQSVDGSVDVAEHAFDCFRVLIVHLVDSILALLQTELAQSSNSHGYDMARYVERRVRAQRSIEHGRGNTEYHAMCLDISASGPDGYTGEFALVEELSKLGVGCGCGRHDELVASGWGELSVETRTKGMKVRSSAKNLTRR